LIRVAGQVLRGAAKVALAVVAVTALLVGVIWMFLQTRRGGELARRIVLPRVNAAIAGRLTLDRFAFGGDRLTLEDVALYDPDGQLVGRVARVDLGFSPLALLRRRVAVQRLEIRRPELTLVADQRGLNLTRALAPRHPPPARPAARTAPAGGGPRVAIDVDKLVVSDGSIDYRSAAPDAGDHPRITDLSIRGGAHFGHGRFAADAAVTVRGGRADARGTFDTVARRGSATAQAAVRGVSVALEGRLDGDALDGRAAIEADDLARAARTLTRDFGLPPIALSGSGHVDASLGGTIAAPSLEVAARSSRLVFGDDSARDLTVAARIPDLRAPTALDLDAGASQVALGARRLRTPSVTVRAAGRHIAVRAAIAAPQPLRVDLSGERRGPNAIAIDALAIRWPEVTWTLRRPARVTIGDRVELSRFELGAGEQRLVADLHLGGARPSGHVTVSRLDLGRLPRALVPAEAGLGGVVDADVSGWGGSSPRVVAKATLAGGRIGKHRDLALDVEGRLDRGRARGELHARGLGVSATARFDLPGAWPPRNANAPITLAVDTNDADLAAVASAFAETTGQPRAPVAGHARVSVHLDGRVGKPRLQVAVAGRSLAFDGRRIGDLRLAIEGEGDGALALRLTSEAPARARIDLTTPLSLRALLRRPPTAAALMHTRFEVKGTVEHLPLSTLALAAGYRARVGGALSSTLSVTGTPAEPEGQVTVDVAGAAFGSYPPTDARVEIGFDPAAVTAHARVVRRQRPLLALETRVGAPVGALFQQSRLAAAPIHLRAVFGPYLVQRLGLPPLSEHEPPRQLQGHLHADLAVDGTLAAPRVLFHAQAGDLRLDKTEVGFGQVEATYADRQAKLDAHLTSRGGGTLRALASMNADLGIAAVRRGFDVRRAPLDVRLDAERFDVAGASGAVQALRTVGGTLAASLSMKGTLAKPHVSGRLEWKDGVLAVTGLGEYRKIHLAVHGDEGGINLDELSAAAGAGTARVTARAKAGANRGYDLTAQAKLDRFPIYSQGQPLAVVSISSRANGHASPAETRLGIDIDEAHIEVKDTKRKDLQSLDAPADIVLMEGGAPLNRAQEARLRALLEKGGPRAEAASSSHPPKIRLHLNAPRHLWVNGNDVYLELGLSPDFRVALGDRTEIHGQVTVYRGRVDVLGRRFDLKSDSTLTFAGDPDRPELDVRAEHVNTTENITVVLTAKGPLDKLSVTVTSPTRPDLGESQLYTLIITGHLQGGNSGATSVSPSSQAASIVGGLLASKLQSTLAHRLPLDVLTIDVGGEGVQGTKLEAGRYVTSRLYVGYIGRVGSDPTRYQNRNAVHLEFQITSRWEIEGEYGDLGTGTADLVWKKNY
jgi:translocation and assembly module TamB